MNPSKSNKMYKKLILIAAFVLVAVSTQAQTQNSSKNESQAGAYQSTGTPTYSFPRYWSFGGNLGLSFWNGGTDILLAPKAYYHVSPKFLTGFGITYIYSDFDDEYFGYHQNSIGGSLMGAIRPIPSFQLSVEYEGLNTTRKGYLERTYWNNALFLGASFVSRNVSFGVRYDVLYDAETSAYGSAWGPVIGFYF